MAINRASGSIRRDLNQAYSKKNDFCKVENFIQTQTLYI